MWCSLFSQVPILESGRPLLRASVAKLMAEAQDLPRGDARLLYEGQARASTIEPPDRD